LALGFRGFAPTVARIRGRPRTFQLPFPVAPWNEFAAPSGAFCFIGSLFADAPHRLFARVPRRLVSLQVFRVYGALTCGDPVLRPCFREDAFRGWLALADPLGPPFGAAFAGDLVSQLAGTQDCRRTWSPTFLRPRKFLARVIRIQRRVHLERA